MNNLSQQMKPAADNQQIFEPVFHGGQPCLVAMDTRLLKEPIGSFFIFESLRPIVAGEMNKTGDIEAVMPVI